MKYIYLDHNIFIKASHDEEIYNALKNLQNDMIQCVYSPAHLEEIFKVEYSDSSNSVNASNLKSLIEDITNGTIFLPSNDEIIVKQEKLKDRFNVVKKYDTREFIENSVQKQFDDIDKNENEISNNLAYVSYRDFWHQAEVVVELEKLQINWNDKLTLYKLICCLRGLPDSLPLDTKLYQNCYEDIKQKHSQLQYIISCLTDILDNCKYYPNKNLHTSSSGVHDLSHMIYATKADYFVTMDKNLFKRCQVIYYYIGIDPKKVRYCKNKAELLDTICFIKNSK